MDFDLELDNAAAIISSEKAKKVCVQLPDGLKPRAKEIVDFLSANTKAQIFIWAGSCFGACDTPDLKGFDVLLQWGHSEWKKA
ncbi:diphthamide synthesis protein [Candidatus Woesearchaeota archaeon]|nr:diphthamide synthesis protein [Candidatus Woesearchaeota archaeon]